MEDLLRARIHGVRGDCKASHQHTYPLPDGPTRATVSPSATVRLNRLSERDAGVQCEIAITHNFHGHSSRMIHPHHPFPFDAHTHLNILTLSRVGYEKVIFLNSMSYRKGVVSLSKTSPAEDRPSCAERRAVSAIQVLSHNDSHTSMLPMGLRVRHRWTKRSSVPPACPPSDRPCPPLPSPDRRCPA